MIGFCKGVDGFCVLKEEDDEKQCCWSNGGELFTSQAPDQRVLDVNLRGCE